MRNYSLEDAADELDYCEMCFDEGIHGGCPRCGIWPPKKPIEIDNVRYRFISNTDKNSGLHVGYMNLNARVLFKKAFDICRKPLDNSSVAIWIAIEDERIAAQAGLFI